MVLLLGKTNWLALSQMPRTTLPQQVLQYSIVGGGSNYMAGTCLPLITLQNIQLYIQMTQKHRGQWQTHPGRNLYDGPKIKGFYSIIGMRTKDKLTKPKSNEGYTTDGSGSLGEGPNPVRQLRIPTHPFAQLDLHSLLLGRKLNIIPVCITKDV